MSVPLYALIGFVLWTLLLVFSVGAVRVTQTLTGKVRSTDFIAGSPHGGDAYWRLNRAHLNCCENLPLFAALVLAAAVIGHSSVAFDRLATVYLAARVAQSLIHIASGSERAIALRFTAYLTQFVCAVSMGLSLLWL